MKKILLGLVLSITLVSSGLGFTRAEILDQLRDLNHQQLEQIQSAKQENVNVKSALASATWANAQLSANKIALEVQIENLKVWGVDQQKQKNEALADVEIQKKLVAAEKVKTEEQHKKAIMAGRERDVFVILFSLLGAYLALSVLTPFIKLIPNPIWQFAAWAAAPVGAFVICLVGIRWLIHIIVNLV